jgi:hypothetical protein
LCQRKEKKRKLGVLWNEIDFRVSEAKRVMATSHTRLRAHNHDTSSTLIGGKGGAGPKFTSHYA